MPHSIQILILLHGGSIPWIFHPHRYFELLPKKLFSIPAGAADLERVWSSALLTMPSKRAHLTKNPTLQIVQLKKSILATRKKRHEHETQKKKKHQHEKDTIDSIMNQSAIDHSSTIDDEDPNDPSIEGQEDSVSKKYDAFSRMHQVLDEEGLDSLAEDDLDLEASLEISIFTAD